MLLGMPDSPDDWNYTVAEYTAIQAEDSFHKYEYIDGSVRLMAGGTYEHSRLAAAVLVQVAGQLRGRPCAVYTSDARVRVGGLITYPDLSIGCGPIQMDTEDVDAQLNPCVLVEVTSTSSERYDRGRKWMCYQQLASLREYVIVSHRERQIAVYSRAEDGTWSGVIYEAGEQASLLSLGIVIDVDELYRDPRKPMS